MSDVIHNPALILTVGNAGLELNSSDDLISYQPLHLTTGLVKSVLAGLIVTIKHEVRHFGNNKDGVSGLHFASREEVIQTLPHIPACEITLFIIHRALQVSQFAIALIDMDIVSDKAREITQGIALGIIVVINHQQDRIIDCGCDFIIQAVYPAKEVECEQA